MRAWPPRLPTLQRPQVAPASMAHCLLLAALLHVWLVLVLGNAPGGTAAPGQGVWGAINVRLQLRAPVSDAPQMAPQPKPEAGGAPGQAVAERWGGAVRPQGPVPEAEPGAAKLGTWGPAPTANPADSAALTAAPSISAGALPALPPLSSTAVDIAAAPAPPAPPSERQLASPLGAARACHHTGSGAGFARIDAGPAVGRARGDPAPSGSAFARAAPCAGRTHTGGRAGRGIGQAH
jgi:hypothetical protein